MATQDVWFVDIWILARFISWTDRAGRPEALMHHPAASVSVTRLLSSPGPAAPAPLSQLQAIWRVLSPHMAPLLAVPVHSEKSMNIITKLYGRKQANNGSNG